MNDSAPVHDKAPKPPGLLPKNAQSWLLISIALVMVLIMWLTGGKKPTTAAKVMPTVPSAQPPVEINETKIAELQSRIQELQREQLVAQSALAQQGRVLDAGAHDPQISPQPAGAGNPNDPKPEDVIQAERKKRAYLSLFASNVALTYRKSPSSAQTIDTASSGPNPVAPGPDAAQIAQLMKELQPNPAFAAHEAPVPARNDSAETPHDRKEEGRNPAAVPAGAANAAGGKNHTPFGGTQPETVILHRT